MSDFQVLGFSPSKTRMLNDSLQASDSLQAHDSSQETQAPETKQEKGSLQENGSINNHFSKLKEAGKGNETIGEIIDRLSDELRVLNQKVCVDPMFISVARDGALNLNSRYRSIRIPKPRMKSSKHTTTSYNS